MTDRLKDYMDDSELPWPQGWQDAFGKYSFFYLAGFKKVMAKMGAVKPKTIERRLAGMSVGTDLEFDPDWHQIYPGPGEDLSQNWYLDQLGEKAIEKLAKGQPVSFAKPMIVLQGLLNQPGASSMQKLPLQIQLANCHIPHFQNYFELLSPLQYHELLLRLGGTQNAPALNDLKLGYPVTRGFAQSIVTYLHNTLVFEEEGERALIRCEQYSDRYEIREAVKQAKGGSRVPNLSTFRPAKGQMTRLPEAYASENNPNSLID